MPDGLSRLKEHLVAMLESIGLGAEFGLDLQDRLVQVGRPASPRPSSGRVAGRLGVQDGGARGTDLQWAWRRGRFS